MTTEGDNHGLSVPLDAGDVGGDHLGIQSSEALAMYLNQQILAHQGPVRYVESYPNTLPGGKAQRAWVLYRLRAWTCVQLVDTMTHNLEMPRVLPLQPGNGW